MKKSKCPSVDWWIKNVVIYNEKVPSIYKGNVTICNKMQVPQGHTVNGLSRAQRLKPWSSSVGSSTDPWSSSEWNGGSQTLWTRRGGQSVMRTKSQFSWGNRFLHPSAHRLAEDLTCVLNNWDKCDKCRIC